mmetsp:Transcript_59522/g.67715  ORF Transcript_59522/g.67715 Transcript_59522/m.67715 type:complete len:116 (-) Transcript_59522:49-396(-)
MPDNPCPRHTDFLDDNEQYGANPTQERREFLLGETPFLPPRQPIIDRRVFNHFVGRIREHIQLLTIVPENSNGSSPKQRGIDTILITVFLLLIWFTYVPLFLDIYPLSDFWDMPE